MVVIYFKTHRAGQAIPKSTRKVLTWIPRSCRCLIRWRFINRLYKQIKTWRIIISRQTRLEYVRCNWNVIAQHTSLEHSRKKYIWTACLCSRDAEWTNVKCTKITMNTDKTKHSYTYKSANLINARTFQLIGWSWINRRLKKKTNIHNYIQYMYSLLPMNVHVCTYSIQRF